MNFLPYLSASSSSAAPASTSSFGKAVPSADPSNHTHVLVQQVLHGRREDGGANACSPTLVGLLALGLEEATHVLQPDRTRPGPQDQRIGAGTVGRHDNRRLRLPIRRPAEEPELLGEFVELEVGEDTDLVLLDLVGRFAFTPRVALGPASCPRAVLKCLVECSKVTFQDVAFLPRRRSATGLPGPAL